MAASSNPQVPAEPELPPNRPVSYISSHMTDIQSEDGETKPHSPPSRPRRNTSRRGPPARHSISAASNHGAGPPSSAGNRMSRTHIPSLNSHAFFRPMSSQRLQMQRSGRPPTGTTQGASEDGQSDTGANQVRRSVISNPMILPAITGIDYEYPPPSRGTEFTDPVVLDRGTSTASPTGNTTIRSGGESARLLFDRSRAIPPPRENVATDPEKSGPPPPQKSPIAFRPSFLKENKAEPQDGAETKNEKPSSASSPGPKPPKTVTPTPFKTVGKNYEFFTGNTIFFFCGRFQNARDRPVNIATGILVALPAALFFAYSAPWVWHNLSPALPIIFAYVFFLCFSSFIHASVVDPGVLPRNLHLFPPPDPTEDPLTLGPPTTDWIMVKLATPDTAAMDVPIKYCKTCNLWRPPRCYHCRTCDNCVETLDHHCVWLNNCVGRRNYRYFFAFVSSATILALYLFGVSLTHILVYQKRERITFLETIDEWRVPFAMVLYGAIAFIYPAALCGYHLFLMGRGETTREYLNSHKFKKDDRHRPFSQGTRAKNIAAVLGRPRPPTYVGFKKPHIEGDQRFSIEKVKHRRPEKVTQKEDYELNPMKGPHTRFEGPTGRGPLGTTQQPEA